MTNSIAFYPAYLANNEPILIAERTKLGATYAGRVNSSGKPIAGPVADMTAYFPTVPVLVQPVPYNPFIVCSTGTLYNTPSTPQTIIGPTKIIYSPPTARAIRGPGPRVRSNYYHSDSGVTIGLQQVPTSYPTILQVNNLQPFG
jgi:hypothetical protein